MPSGGTWSSPGFEAGASAPFGGIDWNQVNRDIYEPVLGPMVQQQLADRPELLAKLSG